MSLILVDGVAELVFVAVDVLRPVFAVLASVYPSLIEFGLDDEDAIDGYYDVVYLCAVAVVCEQKVIYDFVTVAWQFFQDGGHSLFPDFAFSGQEAEKYNCQEADYYRYYSHSIRTLSPQLCDFDKSTKLFGDY